MKRFPLCVIAILLFLSSGVMCSASSMPYIGNKTTKVYHMAECTWGKRIGLNNRAYFISRERAESSGYRRCNYCGDGVIKKGNGGSSYSSGSSPTNPNTNKNAPMNNVSVNNAESEKKTTTKNLGIVIAGIFYGAFIILLIWEFFSGSGNSKKPSKSRCKMPYTQRAGLPITKKGSPILRTNEVSAPSSIISAVKYSDNTLYLTFNNDRTYAYQNVPQSVYEDLSKAPSKGEYFHENIKNIYPYYIPDR